MRLLPLLLLAGCTAFDSRPVPEVVKVPVPVACLPAETPSPPKATPAAALLKMTPRARYLTIAADREAASEYLTRWGPAIEACRR